MPKVQNKQREEIYSWLSKNELDRTSPKFMIDFFGAGFSIQYQLMGCIWSRAEGRRLVSKRNTKQKGKKKEEKINLWHRGCLASLKSS